ncbi:MAG: hypothetical protein AB1898_28895 [Acidobacteriota bacterium]
METRHEVEQALKDLDGKISRIKDKIVDLDAQIKRTSLDDVERIDAELVTLKNQYYELQARELLGEFDAKQKKELEDKIQTAERQLKTEGGRLQNLLGIRHALEAELKKSQALLPQYQANLERFEFESLRQERQNLVRSIHEATRNLETLFDRITEYNLSSMALASRLLERDYEARGFAASSPVNGNLKDKAHQLAQPFDLNQIKNALAQTLSEIISKNLGG